MQGLGRFVYRVHFKNALLYLGTYSTVVGEHYKCAVIYLKQLLLLEFSSDFANTNLAVMVKGPFKCYVTQWGEGGVSFPGKNVTKV